MADEYWKQQMRNAWERSMRATMDETGWSYEQAVAKALSPSQEGVLYGLRSGNQPIEHEDEVGSWADETAWKGLNERDEDGQWQLTDLGVKVAACLP